MLQTATETYQCKFDRKCSKYNNSIILPATLTVNGLRVGATQKLNPCTHGGGSGCTRWRKLTNIEMGWGYK